MKTFVITNSKESDRFSAGDVCDKLNLDCKNLPAIFLENNGKGMCYESSGRKTNLDADSRIKNAKKRREVGCGLAHRNAWLEVVASNEPHLILEDDAALPLDMNELSVVKDSFERFSNTVLENDYDLGHVGYCSFFGVAGECLHAYIVTPDGAKKLIQYSSPCAPRIDSQIRDLCYGEDNKLNCKLAQPNFANSKNTLFAGIIKQGNHHSSLIQSRLKNI
ncbi:MAG: hypothetical protein CMO44_12990 [Verrucomicrobiales bacterium]|nr:hypothetical protein [Verrucomicrobiales bacterium]|tara:strand:+ start:23491 stop:24150 length:660 start_codon:yes stop_codon:yes gene_type:complete